MKNILAICDLETGYASALSDYLSLRKNTPFQVHAFTKAASLLDFLQKQKPEVMLISGEVLYEIRKYADELSETEIFVLSEDGQLSQYQGHKTIYKYQSTENILREVMNYYAEAPKAYPGRANLTGPDFIGIYSPVKRTLKTSFALTLGQILTQKRKTLYINLEEYAGFNNLLKISYMTDMSDLMYYISQNKPNFIWKLASIVQNIGGLDYIPPALSPLDIKNISAAQWLNFFSELGKCEYELVILDLGESVQGIFDILRSCSRIYTPVRDDGFSLAKLEQYEALLRVMEYEDILEKTRKLSFSYFKGLDKGLDHLLYSELGNYARKILEMDGFI